MCARFGSNELQASWCYEKSAGIGRKKKSELLNKMKNNAGFFPKDEEYLKKFSLLMKESTGKADLLGVWYNPMEDYMIDRYAPNCRLCQLRGLEPWYVTHPWTKALEGKKVVVIHPFAKTIQSVGDRFRNWFEAFDWVFREAMKTDFEVAIIGCGAYGFPLAAKLKEGGKQAIHMGGATQLLFGIKGIRWDSHSIIKNLYNKYWVRPDESERPEGAESVEQGCYW